MKKLSILFAFLCMSMMSWATAVYTGTPFSGDLNGYTYNIAYTVTYNDDYSITFTAEFTGTFTETIGLVFEVWSSDLSTGNFKSFVKGDGNTWSVTDNKDYSSMEGESLNQLRLRIASQAGGTDQLFISSYTVGLDNTTPVVPDSEKPVMGAASLASVAGDKAVINVAATDNIGVTKYHVVDATNSFDALFTPKNSQITVTGLTGNTNYNFTITAKDAAGNESLNSATVAATTTSYYTEPQEAATDPTLPAAQVMSLYSDTYTPAATIIWANWGDAVAYAEQDLGTGKVMKVTMGDWKYVGFEFASLNITTMKKVHVDLWSEIAFTTYFFLIDKGRIEVNVPAQTWYPVDLDLPLFDGADLTNVTNGKLADGGQKVIVYLDNLYFYTDTASAITDTETDINAVKVIENGQLFIIKNGVRYNALGVEVR